MSERCERKDHKRVLVTEKGFAYPTEGFRGVADSMTRRRMECRRRGCDLVGEWETVERHSLDGLTLNSEWWDRLQTTGILITDRHRRALTPEGKAKDA